MPDVLAALVAFVAEHQAVRRSGWRAGRRACLARLLLRRPNR